MSEALSSPTVRPGGLVTIAYLKARFDEGNDHLGMFMPLLIDVLGRVTEKSFTTNVIQEALAKDHGVAIPQQTVGTLLSRAVSKGYLTRETGGYQLTAKLPLKTSSVASSKAEIEEGQLNLAAALCDYAKRRNYVVDSTEAALDMIFRFLEAEQVTLLLSNHNNYNSVPADGQLERAVIAEFIQNLVIGDSVLLSVLKRMLEGLVLYHAAFLPDLAHANRRFKNLRVMFDSNLVRQTLGYEGNAMRALMRETLDILKASGVQCLVFDKTVLEIKRLLFTYEEKLATSQGRASLRPAPMTRHFLLERYTPSDIKEMSLLLEKEIISAGFQMVRVPNRVPEYTAGERALAERLSNPLTKDELSPRVVHDVDCIAGILTLRKGHRSSMLEEAQVVFATSSPLVVRNSRLWWEEDESEVGIEPVVHIRALSNLAWLKKPSLCGDFKLKELVALCTAALRPAQATWDRFLRHLDILRQSQRITSDEITAILISGMSDNLLREAELAEEDPEEIDVVTLNEVIDRVKASYAGDAQKKLREVEAVYADRLAEVQSEIQAVRSDYDKQLAQLEKHTRETEERAGVALRSASESLRSWSMVIEGRSRRWASWVAIFTQGSVVSLLCAGAIALIISFPFYGGWVGRIVMFPVVVFVGFGLMSHVRFVSTLRSVGETRLTKLFRDWLAGDTKKCNDNKTGDR